MGRAFTDRHGGVLRRARAPAARRHPRAGLAVGPGISGRGTARGITTAWAAAPGGRMHLAAGSPRPLMGSHR